MSSLTPDALERWTYRKDGMDYGPFSTKEVLDLLRKGVLTPETELANRRERKWQKVQEYPRFAAFLAAEEEARKRQEVEREVAALERTATSHRKAPLLLVVFAGLVVGVVAIVVLRPDTPQPAGYPVTFFRSIGVDRLPTYSADEVARWKAAALSDTAVASKPARKLARRVPRQVSDTAGPGSANLAVAVDLSDSEEDDNGRSLSQADLDKVQRLVAPALVRCFREEATRNPGFQGGTVSLYLLNRGAVQVSKITTTPAPGPELVACARSATKGISFEPYSGQVQVMELPIYVSTSR